MVISIIRESYVQLTAALKKHTMRLEVKFFRLISSLFDTAKTC